MWDFPQKFIVCEIKSVNAGELPVIRDILSKHIVGCVQDLQLDESFDAIRQDTTKLVAGNDKFFKPGHSTKSCREKPRKLIISEDQVLQVCHFSQGVGKLFIQCVLGQI